MLSDILEMASLDILNALGVGDRVVGTASTRLEYLQDYINDEIANLGTIKEAALEAVMACEPDVIFISGRLSSSYDALSEIAPVVFLATDTELGIVESVRRNAATIASMFGLEDQVDELMAGFDARIQALQAVSEGQAAIVGMCTSGSFNVPGNDGRCSIIGVETGFENIGVDANIDTSTHGNEASFEFLEEKAPDYIFVMDRDAAIGTDSAQLAQDIMEGNRPGEEMEPEKTELEVIPEDGLGTFTVPVTVWAGEEGRNLVLYGMCAYGGQTEAVSLLLEKTEGSSGGVTPSSAAAPVWRPVRYAPAEPLEE